ncbi:MAG TPA: hypothetical protein VF069_16180, partial [Streptosporangiaceae bacterium]
MARSPGSALRASHPARPLAGWLAAVAFFVTVMTLAATVVFGLPLLPALVANLLAGAVYAFFVGEYMVLLRRRVFPRRDERRRWVVSAAMLAAYMGGLELWADPPHSAGDLAYVGIYLAGAAAILLRLARTRTHVPVRLGLVVPRTAADARRLVETCVELDTPDLSPDRRYLVRMNRATAHIVAAGDADPHRNILQAYQLLMELYRGWRLDPSGRGVWVAQRLVQLAAVQNQVAPDLTTYERALDLLHEEIQRHPDSTEARLTWFANRADFLTQLIAHNHADDADDADGLDKEIRRRTEIVNLLRAAVALARPADRTELRLRLVTQLCEYVERSGDITSLDEGIEYGRAMLRKIGRIERETRPIAQVLVARLLELRALAAVPPDDAGLDEAERLLGRACATVQDAEQRSVCWLFLALLLRLRYELAGSAADGPLTGRRTGPRWGLGDLGAGQRCLRAVRTAA